ncbi:MAG: NADH-dependent flavin oxidoreductase, Oye family [Deltaproteobacteria bacterium]|jgi:2,4-dienoyl-CoA reductase-like NADH-dependent reductase (Old Yellow Enzyme family)|nr:NADH-dependent flavin oxidoreductase, Oye family [Deltaproteobacteria bacterium]
MPVLFEEVRLNGMKLRNRFVRSATWEGLAGEDGSSTPRLDGMMADLAKNRVGLIVSGYAYVSQEGQSSPRQLAVHDNRFLPGLAGMAGAVHSEGGRIALQLVHGGAFSNSGLTGVETVGPSAEGAAGKGANRAMTREEIARIVSAFAGAAARAKHAGFDAVQIHAAHGFLISQFLAPAFNRREDKYGGTLSNRARFLHETVGSVRAAVGAAYPVLVKLNSEDFLDGGMTADEALRVAEMLAEASVDAIELSGGTVASPQQLLPPRPGLLARPEKEVFYRNAARAFKEGIRIPLMLVGGIRSFEVAERLVRDGVADYVCLSRPLVREPGLVRRWAEGDHRKSSCISCNGCFGPASDGRGIFCVAENP